MAVRKGTSRAEKFVMNNEQNEVRAAGGNDSVFGGISVDEIYGGTGHDFIDAGKGRDMVFGDGGMDTLVGGGGSDNLNGGNGNDIISGGIGNNTIDGGAGIDMVDYSDTYNLGFDVTGLDARMEGIYLNLVLGEAVHSYTHRGGNPTGSFDLNRDKLMNIENVTGTELNDRLLGDGMANKIIGGHGNDTIFGDGGNDTLDGGADADEVKGGEGNDVITGGRDQTQDLLFGGDGNDTITLYKRDIATGGSGRDVFVIEKFGSAGGVPAPESMTIKDFVTDVDKIDFSSVADQFSDLKIEEHTDKMLVTVKGTGISIELSGVDMLTANDFMF